MAKIFQVNVKLFSHARYILGREELRLDVRSGTTAGEILNLIYRKGGDELVRVPVRLAVNQKFVEADEIVHEGDEVAIIPPVQGG